MLNTSSIVLVQKKDGGEGISDFSPISLTYGVAKLITGFGPSFATFHECSNFKQPKRLHQN